MSSTLGGHGHTQLLLIKSHLFVDLLVSFSSKLKTHHYNYNHSKVDETFIKAETRQLNLEWRQTYDESKKNYVSSSYRLNFG